MSLILESLTTRAARSPSAEALAGTGGVLGYGSVHDAVFRLAERLQRSGTRVLGLLADNGPEWVLADLAAIAAGVCLVPLPMFFSASQIRHALRAAAVDTVLAIGGAGALVELPEGEATPLGPIGPGLASGSMIRLNGEAGGRAVPPGTAKITFTSGTTGEPKGVCLALDDIERVARSLCVAAGAQPDDVHLGCLPLSTLLENIGGVYVPMLVGATSVFRPLADLGLAGSTGPDPSRLASALRDSRATSAILVPQLLHALLATVASGGPRPDRLRFVAVGGAPVPRALLRHAAAASIPVFEGYGLSECASVVALNRPGACREGSVGRPLPHARVSLSADGEVLASGAAFLGYAGDAPRDPAAPVSTGDIGRFDGDGFLHITGRRKSIFITAYGRNVAPEWVEGELCAHPAIAQAAVFGEGRPWNAAVIVPRGASADVDGAIRSVNAALPDYARVTRWIRASGPFSPANGQLTPNGRIRRASVSASYARELAGLYEETFA